MLRRYIPVWARPVLLGSSTAAALCGGPTSAFSTPLFGSSNDSGPHSRTTTSALYIARRTIKTLDVREYRPLGTPIEFRFYQRYANHPNRQSGIQFLTHYNTHQRFRVNKDYIDYMNWGREQGQARLPHRWQRVAFDFNDALNPTRVDRASREWFHNQDPSEGIPGDLSTTFDPNKKLFSEPEHWNKMFSKRGPGEGDIRLRGMNSQSLLGPLVTQTDTQEPGYFKMETRGPLHGKVPGINSPYLGERDGKMVQAMSRPLNQDCTLTTNEGRFSKTIFINEPARHQALSGKLAKELNRALDKATNALYSKLTVLQAAQSGQTDAFCTGVDMEALGFDMGMAAMLRARAEELRSAPQDVGDAQAAVKRDREVQALLHDAVRHTDRADAMLREHADLIWRVYTAPRPLMTLVNGRCRGSGCGVALAAKYCALRDSSEFVFDGPEVGLTPYGGMTRLLARPETALKFPGLAEFVLLTGTALFSGDVLRLGWTDLFTTLPDMAYHIKEWFDASEHMHNDAVAWQLGHLLDTCFRMKGAHSSAMERAAISPVRARWVEDAFADQSSVEAIVETLGQMERLPLSDRHNTLDECRATPFTLENVYEGIAKLEAAQLRYSLSPWDITAPEEEVVVRQASEIFTSYVLERRGEVNVVLHRDREKLRRWQEQREREYVAYTELKRAPHPRHVYVRLEGCENTVVEFDHIFNSDADVAASGGADALPGTSAVGDTDGYSRRMLNRLTAEALSQLGMPTDRDVELGWYVPTLDTCPVRSDAELMEVLHSDPGLEDPAAGLTYPPVYFVLKRNTLHMSEWAYAVKHQMLMQSPFALKATFEMLSEVRAASSKSGGACSLADALAIEFKYMARTMQRPDFHAVGQHTTKSSEGWEDIKEERRRNIHKTLQPTRPLPDFDAVFDRDVMLSGHRFALRPRWSPGTLEEVRAESIAQLRAPLSCEVDGVARLCPVEHSGKADRLEGMIDDAGGLEVVSGLGELDGDTGRPRVPPLKGNAHVPTSVNFYEMARHPWDDTPSSWRRDGFTAGSQAYFEQQYAAAERAVYDEEGRGTHGYWPSRGAVEGLSGAEAASGDALLEERLYGPLAAAERGIEGWARTLRQKAVDGKLRHKTEIATQQEKIYDDEYYRWFIQPGLHPNRSGMLLGRKQAAGGGGEGDRELDAFISSMLSSAAGLPDVGGSEAVEESMDGGDVEDDDVTGDASAGTAGDGPTEE